MFYSVTLLDPPSREKERDSQSNKSVDKYLSPRSQMMHTTTPLSNEVKEYLNSVEILNRQSLPLQPNFNQKVQNYFKSND